MVAPVQGPFTVTEDFSTFYRRRDCYKQAKPHDLPLPYRYLTGKVTAANGLTFSGIASQTEQIRAGVMASSQKNQLKILMYEKLLGSISDSSSMGENLAEFNKSLATIANRARQLYDIVRMVRKGVLPFDLLFAANKKDVARHQLKGRAKDWLEYHLGVEPVIRDIYNAVNLLQQPIKHHRAVGSASVSGFTLSEFLTSERWSANVRQKCTGMSGRCQADVAITNPNLYLANKLGVLNPVQVAWQLMPLSFIVDWFINVEQFLGTATDFLGLTVLNASATYKYTCEYNEWWNTYGWTGAFGVYGFERELGVPVPSLAVRPYKALGWQRGLTAISLLIPALKSLDDPKRPLRKKSYKNDPVLGAARRGDFRDRSAYSGGFSF